MTRTTRLLLFLAALTIVTLADSASAMYDPGMARFMQRDPYRTDDRMATSGDGYQDGMNLYVYGAASPAINSDPTGTSVIIKGTDCTVTSNVIGHKVIGGEASQISCSLPRRLCGPGEALLGCALEATPVKVVGSFRGRKIERGGPPYSPNDHPFPTGWYCRMINGRFICDVPTRTIMWHGPEGLKEHFQIRCECGCIADDYVKFSQNPCVQFTKNVEAFRQSR